MEEDKNAASDKGVEDFRKGMEFEATKMYAKAIDSYTLSLAENHKPEVVLRIACCSQKMRNYKEAKENFDTFIHEKGVDQKYIAVAMLQRAICEYLNNEFDEAVKSFNNAKEFSTHYTIKEVKVEAENYLSLAKERIEVKFIV